MITDLSSLPTWVVALLAVVALAQITLDIIALVDLYRRPADRVLIGNKWVWLAVILLVSFIGAILYLLAGRKPAEVAEPAATRASSPNATLVADSLYGTRDDPAQR